MATRLAILARGRSRTRFLIICFILNNTCDELGSEVNAKAALEDVGYNADLYIAIQEDNMQN